MKQARRKSRFDQKLLIRDHIHELATRFYWWLLFFIIGSILGYLKYNYILNWLITPLGKPLFFTSPIGGFEVVFGVASMVGFLVALPVLIYQIIKFVEPAFSLIDNSKLYAYAFLSFMLAIVGVLISYYLIFPASLTFLSKFGTDQLSSLISTKDYFPFISKYLIGFAILFQFPLVVYLVSLITPITAGVLAGKFKYIITASFILAAVLTPTPDPVNQTIMAAPLIFLYFLTILILYIKQVIVK